MQRFLSRDARGGYKSMNVIIEEDVERGQGALWLGDYTAAQDRRLLREKGIKCVLTVA